MWDSDFDSINFFLFSRYPNKKNFMTIPENKCYLVVSKVKMMQGPWTHNPTFFLIYSSACLVPFQIKIFTYINSKKPDIVMSTSDFGRQFMSFSFVGQTFFTQPSFYNYNFIYYRIVETAKKQPLPTSQKFELKFSKRFWHNCGPIFPKTQIISSSSLIIDCGWFYIFVHANNLTVSNHIILAIN